MKKVLAFAKANLVSVISVVVAVIVLPVLLFLSMNQRAGVQEEVQGDLDSMNRTLQQVEFGYVFEPVRPGEGGVEFSRTPNEATNAAMRSWGDQLREQAASAIELIVERNSAGKRLLLEGLFPAPRESERVSKLQEIVSIWPVAHRGLLERAGAGTPPDREVLEVALNGMYRQEVDRVRSKLNEVSAEEYARIREGLAEARLTAYRDTAAELRFYVDDDAFSSVQAWGANSLPPLSVVWDWQWRHWIHSDLVDALRLANTSADGWERSLLEGPLKRVERVEVPEWTYSARSAMQQQGQEYSLDYKAPIRLDWGYSMTGLTGWPGAPNGLFDVRYATVAALVDSARIGTVVDSINATNLMTVVDVRVEDVDTSGDLTRGYVYGQGHVVRATFTVETVWLRSWMKAYMPEDVRGAMGVPPDPEVAEESADDGA